MGGLLILVATTLPFVILSRSTEAMLVLFATLACGAIGFFDDWMKIVKRRSLGVSARWRIALLVIAAVLVVAVEVVGLPTTLMIPVLDESFEIGAVAFFLVVFLVGRGGERREPDRRPGQPRPGSPPSCCSPTPGSPSSLGRTTWRSSAPRWSACVGFLWFNLPGGRLHGRHGVLRPRRRDRGHGRDGTNKSC